MCLVRVRSILVWLLFLVDEHRSAGQTIGEKRNHDKISDGSTDEASSSAVHRDWFPCDSDADNLFVNANDYIYRGIQLQYEKQYEEAIECFSRAIALNASEPTYHKLRGICYLDMENIQAKVDFQTVSRLERKAREERLAISEKLFASNMFQEAMQELLILGDTDELVNLAARLNEKGEYKKALFCCEVAISEDPNSPRCYRERAKCFARLKFYRQAIDDFRKLVQLDSLNLMNQLSVIMDIEKYDDIPRGYTEYMSDKEWGALGDEYFAQKKYGDAIQCYFQAADANLFEERYYWQQGRCYMEIGDTSMAMSYFLKAMELDPNNEYSRALLKQALLDCVHFDATFSDSLTELSEEEIRTLGYEFFARQKFAAAVQCFSSAINKNPGEQGYYKMRAISYLELREPSLAVEDFHRIMKMDQDENLWQWLGDTLFTDKHEGIIQDFLQGLTESELESLGNLLLSSENKVSEAIRCYSLAIAKNPREYRYYKIRGQYYAMNNALEKAALDYFNMIRTGLGNEEDCTLLTQTLMQIHEFTPPITESLHVLTELELEKLGFELIRIKKFETAIHCCTESIRQNPSEARHYLQRAMCHMRLGNWTMAFTDLVHLLEMQPRNRSYQLSFRTGFSRYLMEYVTVSDDVLAIIPHSELAVIAKQFSFVKKYDEALRCYSAAISHNPRGAHYYVERGNCHLALKNSVMAAEDFGKALQLQPGNEQITQSLIQTLLQVVNATQISDETLLALSENELVSLGYDFSSKDQWVHAIRCYSANIKKNPAYAEYYRMRGVCHSKTKHASLAINDYRRALSLDPQRADDRFTLSGLLIGVGRYEEAAQEMLLAPRNHAEFAKLGDRFAQLGRFEEAILCFTEAIKDNPVEGIYYRKRAHGYRRIRNWKKAIEDHRKAIQFRPIFEYFMELSATLVLDNRYEEAKSVLQDPRLRAHPRVQKFLEDIEERMKKDRQTKLLNYLRDLMRKDMQRQFDQLFQETWFSGTDDAAYQKVQDMMESYNVHSKNLSDAYAEYNNNEASKKSTASSVASTSATPAPTASTSAAPLRSGSPTDVSIPEYLQDKITYELMTDPVVTPTGVTYDRASIQRSLATSPTDPYSREPLHPHQLRPNLALREAIRDWKEKNYSV